MEDRRKEENTCSHQSLGAAMGQVPLAVFVYSNSFNSTLLMVVLLYCMRGD